MGNTLYEDSEFRQEIISILKRPYDQAEYEKLLQDVKVQKPVERNLELRHGREKRCPLNKKGKSYLDHYDGKNLCFASYLSRSEQFFFCFKVMRTAIPYDDFIVHVGCSV